MIQQAHVLAAMPGKTQVPSQGLAWQKERTDSEYTPCVLSQPHTNKYINVTLRLKKHRIEKISPGGRWKLNIMKLVFHLAVSHTQGLLRRREPYCLFCSVNEF